MLKEFEDYRREIRILKTDKKFHELLRVCRQYLNKLNKLNNDNDCVDRWFVYYNFAKAYEGLHVYEGLQTFDMVIKYAMKALTYVENEEWRKTEQSYSIWQLAACYEDMGNINQAIYHFKKLSQIYRSIGAYKQRICVMANYAHLRNDAKALNKIINIYQSDWFKYHLETEKLETYNQLDDALIEMYNMLIDIHKKHNETDKIFLVINSIKDQLIKKLMLKHIQVQSIEQIS